MPLTAQCPSCGAPVVFRSASSVFAVCEYCSSTLVRHDQRLDDIGKMAALAEDRSPLQIGSEGQYRGIHFALIGRIQLRYAQGVWNEWHLLFDDMRTGWLSDAGGEYVLTFSQPVMEPVPAFDTLKIGQRLQLASQVWTVSNLEKAECIAGQGELPFKVGAGYPLLAVDLRNERHFATLDYSEMPPLVFIGEAVDFAALGMANLREGIAMPTRTVAVRVFRCPGCGAPMQARSKEILAVACVACGTVVDTADENYKVLSAAQVAQDELFAPRLALGRKGTLQGQPVEVIGFLVRRCRIDGVSYHWREYLLAGEQGGYRWLTEYDGHWNVADVLSRPPRTSGIETEAIRYEGLTYRHFQSSAQAEVVQVAGEFFWQVRRGECADVVDYVCPPSMLARESTGNDLNWSKAEYLAPAEIAKAFSLPGELPAPVGVFANQPNPWQAHRRHAFGLLWKLALLALLVQGFFLFDGGGRSLLRQSFTLSAQQGEVTTKEFQLARPLRKLVVTNQTSLDNNWIGLDMMLVNKQTGLAWPASRELSFYHGYDDGYWSEGNNADEVVFHDIPAGTYYLTLEPDLAPENPVAVHDTLEVRTGGAGWSNFVILLVFLMVFPVLTLLRHAAFENRRWLESDHPPENSADADGDDD